MTQQNVVVRRRRRNEAEQAIQDLEARGFEVTYPLAEVSKDGKSFKNDGYRRQIFVENNFSTCWIAKLRRVVE